MRYVKVNLQFFAQEKTEKATPKKRQDTRKKGQVAKSSDINTAIILLLVFLFLWFMGSVVGNKLSDLLRHTYQEYLLMDLTVESVSSMFIELTIEMSISLFPIIVGALIAGIFSNLIQVGPLFAPEAIKFKLSKLNPIQGAKRIFSARALVELVKSLLKIVLVGALVFAIIWMNLDSVLLLSQKPIGDGLYTIAKLTAVIGLSGAFLLLVLAIPDYLYQKYDHEKQIRMSKQDVKQEHKNMDGDPLIKSKRKQKQMQMSMKRMIQEIPKADVVITNPTHFAVALKYDSENMAAPVVLAKGVDHLALKIREIASEHKVTQVENKPLARALYAQADIGDSVPEDLFRAVAEVLAYVYQLKNK